MEYEVIKEITEEQYERIKSEFGRPFRKEFIRMVYANGKEIGFCTTFFIDGKLTIEYYLFKEYQHQGFGNSLVYLASDSIGGEYPEYNSLYLLIHRDNIASLSVAKKNGYELASDDYDFMWMIEENMPGYYLYSKENSYYKKKAERDEIRKVKMMYESKKI